jgi:membrane fusion protein, multidrug efflux system
MEIHYREGDTVHQGDLLIQIDPRPFQVQLTEAEGQLAKDQAALANARIDLTRYQTLLTQNAIPEQQVATQKALVTQDEGMVKSDEGQVDSAKLNLVYCRITAPITGRIGLRLVDPGNIVHASDPNGLLVITQIEPISVLFTVAEDQLPVVLQKMRTAKLQVDAYDRDMKQKLAQGTLTTVDNQIDQTTGTVRLRATFDNKDDSLFPNQFVNARLLVQEKRGVILLPSAAIQRSANATFVYLIQPDSTVTVRNITEGTTEGDVSEITSGLNDGDAVVMTGADKLEEGSKVNAQFPQDNSRNASQKRGGAPK